MEQRILPSGNGYFYCQCHGAFAKNSGHRLTILAHKKKAQHEYRTMHFIYEVVEFVGRWSMIDIFVVAVLSASVRIGQLINIYPAIGALLFALLVILTMFAALTFDPRLIWDQTNGTTKEGAAW